MSKEKKKVSQKDIDDYYAFLDRRQNGCMTAEDKLYAERPGGQSWLPPEHRTYTSITSITEFNG